MSKRAAHAVVVAAVVGAVAAGSATRAEALPIAVSSSLHLIAQADAGSGTVADTDSQSQAATTNPLFASVLAVAIDGGASVDATATALATFLSTAAGTVQFTDVGWDTVAVTFGLASSNSGTDWTYSFTASDTGLFNLSWNITEDAATTDNFGLNGFQFNWSAGGGDFLLLNTTGSLSRAVTAGVTYTVQIENEANISGGLGSTTAFMDADFTWSIDPAAVPEPTTLLLLGSGLALAGMRRRLGKH